MQLIYAPTLPPGCCFICRASIRDSYVDTGISLDYEGAFYICNACVTEMAKLYAYLSFDEYKDLRLAKEDLERQNYALIKRLGELEELEDALARAGYRLADDGSVARFGGYAPENNEGREAVASGTKNSVGTRKRKTVEQSDDEGVGELHSDESSSDSEFTLEF